MDKSSGISPVIRKDDPQLMEFPDAIQAVIAGNKITKLEWETNEIWGVLKDGFLMLHKDDDKFYQWVISEGDLVGDDWMILIEGN